jgi:multidrug efflux pump subunit AcrA (membrane-fusion protein)
MKHHKSILLLLTIASLLLGACSLLQSQSPPTDTSIPVVQHSDAIISNGNLVPRDYAYLAFPTGGHVAEILVAPGDAVTQGQVLARLGDREPAQANLAAAQLEQENAQQTLDSLNENVDISTLNAGLALLNANQQVITARQAWNAIDTDVYQEQIDNADLRVAEAQTALDDAQAEFDIYKDLDANNTNRQRAETALNSAQNTYDQAVSERDQWIIDRDRAQLALELAQALQVQAQHDYDNTRSGPNPDQLALAQMRLENAQAQVAAAQSALDLRDLKAPFAGAVVDVNVGLNDLIGSDTWAVLLADYSEWYVETNDLNELEVVAISTGQGAVIAPDALPDLTFQGEVTEIANISRLQSGDVLYQVRLRVAEPDPAFRWGMTVEVTFDLPR